MQYSYGVIPFLKYDGGYKFLLVQHLGGHRSFPKGQMESGETPLQTAKREVLEETGLFDIKIIPNLYFDHYYSFFDKNGNIINKRVGFFVGEVYDDSIVLQKKELKNYCWENLENTLNLLTFDSDRGILEKAYEALK